MATNRNFEIREEGIIEIPYEGPLKQRDYNQEGLKEGTFEYHFWKYHFDLKYGLRKIFTFADQKDESNPKFFSDLDTRCSGMTVFDMNHNPLDVEKFIIMDENGQRELIHCGYAHPPKLHTLWDFKDEIEDFINGGRSEGLKMTLKRRIGKTYLSLYVACRLAMKDDPEKKPVLLIPAPHATAEERMLGTIKFWISGWNLSCHTTSSRKGLRTILFPNGRQVIVEVFLPENAKLAVIDEYLVHEYDWGSEIPPKNGHFMAGTPLFRTSQDKSDV